METKFTPGPWHVGGDGTIIYASDGFAVANATCFHGQHTYQSEANARIIAAAPELLESLQKLCDIQKYGDVASWASEWFDARDAIAKATRSAS